MGDLFLNSRKRSLVFIAGASFIIAACSSGGSSSGGGGSASVQGNANHQERSGVQQSDPNSEMIGQIARNTPLQGSVTQSARGQNNISLDHVEYDTTRRSVIINDDLVVPITAERWSGFHYGADGLDDNYEGPYFVVDNNLRGHAVAFIMSRVELDDNNLPTSYGLDDTDPVVMGVWDYISDDNTQVVSGLFVDGLAEDETPQANIPSSGTATFVGRSYGWFAGEALERAFDIKSAHFDATATLSANWEESTISGQVSDFHQWLTVYC